MSPVPPRFRIGISFGNIGSLQTCSITLHESASFTSTSGVFLMTPLPVPVPVPSTFGLMVLGLAAGLWHASRQRRWPSSGTRRSEA